MARQEKEMSVEDRLKALYHLQKILSEVDRIKTLRGELPLEVQDLEDGIEGLNTRIAKYEDDIVGFNEEIHFQQGERENNLALIDKYKKNLDDVRNNREYDSLQKEIEYCQLNIELAEKKMREAADKIEHVKAEIEKVKEQLADDEHVLVEKTNELSEIVSETKQDEEKLREQAKKLENKIEARLLAAFKRIRKNARNGLGVVYVQRNACGGCFNRIPAQRQMEIKMH
ncbi:MAG: hypothetical protein MJZ74_01000, partial [Muribaculaceae bacterium]|nr:hypothetical protein [Muribaculaceae bacterium]